VGSLIAVITNPIQPCCNVNRATVRQERTQSGRDAMLSNFLFYQAYCKSSQITLITNPRQPCPIPPQRGREPLGGSRHLPKTDPGLGNCCYHGSRQPCLPCSRHIHSGHGSKGDRPAPERQPLKPSRAKKGNARRPYFLSFLRSTQAGDPAGNDRHYPKPELGLPDYYYHESQLALQLNRWVAWAP